MFNTNDLTRLIGSRLMNALHIDVMQGCSQKKNQTAKGREDEEGVAGGGRGINRFILCFPYTSHGRRYIHFIMLPMYLVYAVHIISQCPLNDNVRWCYDIAGSSAAQVFMSKTVSILYHLINDFI